MQLNEASLMLLEAAQLPAPHTPALIPAPDLSKSPNQVPGSTFQAHCGCVSPQVSSY